MNFSLVQTFKLALSFEGMLGLLLIGSLLKDRGLTLTEGALIIFLQYTEMGQNVIQYFYNYFATSQRQKFKVLHE